MKNLELGKYYEKMAFKLMKFDLEECKNVEEFKKLSNLVLSYKDPIISYIFTKRVSLLCYSNQKYQDALNVPAHEDIVVKSLDEELMYLFARDVAGADLKHITSAMPKNSPLRKEIEKDMQPIGEFNL